MGYQLNTNLGLPETPKGVPPEMFAEFLRIYNALRLLAAYTESIAVSGGGGGTSTNDPSVFLLMGG